MTRWNQRWSRPGLCILGCAVALGCGIGTDAALQAGADAASAARPDAASDLPSAIPPIDQRSWEQMATATFALG